MTCYYPMLGYISGKTESGKNKINIFAKSTYLEKGFRIENWIKNNPDKSIMTIPCGRCLGCRLDYSRQWAIRCYHETKFHDQNCFVTLTYNDKYLPKNKELSLDELTRFIKRVRRHFAYPGFMPAYDKAMRITYYKSKAKKYAYRYGLPKVAIVYRPILYYGCGEYGKEGTKRPHYHICFFGIDFEDKEVIEFPIWKKSKFQKGDHLLYTSKTLQNIWSDPKTGESKGFVTVGEVTLESAGYVARYTTKKIINDPDDEDKIENPEFSICSKRPAIGKKFYEKYTTDIYPKDFITFNGMKFDPPRYYDKLLEKNNPKLFEQIKERRQTEAEKNQHTSKRLRDKAKFKEIQTKILERTIK